MSIIILLNQF